MIKDTAAGIASASFGEPREAERPGQVLVPILNKGRRRARRLREPFEGLSPSPRSNLAAASRALPGQRPTGVWSGELGNAAGVTKPAPAGGATG